jgi:hypothetical protein
MCLSCSGVHRGLGVHISFIRSITMDAFKGSELARMAAGGNKPFQEFFNSHSSNTKDGKKFDTSSIQERYDSEAGDEWKERLSCKVESREFDRSNLPKRAPKKETTALGTGAPLSGRASASGPGSRSNTPLGKTRSNEIGSQRSGSPALGTNAMSQKAKNEAYFSRMGAENANRRDDVAPNQGGKFGGFGSEPAHWKKDDEPGAPPALDDFQKDPVAALTKSFGWLGASVSKAGKTGYEGWVKPGLQKVCRPTRASFLYQLTHSSSPRQTSPLKPAKPQPWPLKAFNPAQQLLAALSIDLSKVRTIPPTAAVPTPACPPTSKTFGIRSATSRKGRPRTSRTFGRSLEHRQRGPVRISKTFGTSLVGARTRGAD